MHATDGAVTRQPGGTSPRQPKPGWEWPFHRAVTGPHVAPQVNGAQASLHAEDLRPVL